MKKAKAMAKQRIVHDDSDEQHFIDISRIKPSQLTLIGLRPEQVDLYDIDDLIRLYEKTFEYVGPDEHPVINVYQRVYMGEEQRREAERKAEIWDIRWAIADRIPELLEEFREQGKDISLYIDWLHRQLIRKFSPPTVGRTFGKRILDKLLDYLLGGLGLKDRHLDREVLGEFIFSMSYYEIFNEHTWEYLLKMRGYLDNESYTYFLVLIQKIYSKFHSSGLKKFLEKQAAKQECRGPFENNERCNALIKTARVILKEQKIKSVSPPYSVGIAIEE